MAIMFTVCYVSGLLVYSQQFCPDVSIYVCLSARSTRAAKLQAAAD